MVSKFNTTCYYPAVSDGEERDMLGDGSQSWHYHRDSKQADVLGTVIDILINLLVFWWVLILWWQWLHYRLKYGSILGRVLINS